MFVFVFFFFSYRRPLRHSLDRQGGEVGGESTHIKVATLIFARTHFQFDRSFLNYLASDVTHTHTHNSQDVRASREECRRIHLKIYYQSQLRFLEYWIGYVIARIKCTHYVCLFFFFSPLPRDKK